jgi:DMSO/TMAO reductase YedYZ molybdopterin-dependent catalytic subunit
MTPRRVRVLAAVAGVAAAIVTVGVAEVVAALLGGVGSPFFAVGSLVIDLAPPVVKDAVIALFGTADKLVLGILLAVLVLLLAAVAGLIENRRSPFGVVLLGLVAVVAMVAAGTRVDAGPLAALPTAVGAVVGVLVLRLLIARLQTWAAPASHPGADGDDRRLDRRRFLGLAIAASAAAAIAGAVARTANAAAQTAAQARAAFRLPTPVQTVDPVAPAADLDVEGLSSWLTANDDFYRIDIALQVPRIDPSTWTLRIHGMVEEEVVLTMDDVLALPMSEHYVTLACVSNTVGGDLIGNARWLGHPVRDLLALARPTDGADMALSSGPDGFTAGTPLEVLLDEERASILAIGMNGEPLPIEHGFPARLVVPGLYGYVSATKWITEIEITRFADAQGYWTPRGWSELGPIKLASRIDAPSSNVRAGEVTIAGVAWAQHTGVSRVEVDVDGSGWREATLASVVTVDTWVQWTYSWDARSGSHTIRVRASDTDGNVQTEQQAPPAPDGATGWHEVQVSVA